MRNAEIKTIASFFLFSFIHGAGSSSCSVPCESSVFFTVSDVASVTGLDKGTITRVCRYTTLIFQF